jgi:CHAT domain
MTGFKYPTTPFRDLLANRLRALYDDRSDPEETARELQIVGVELVACLPVDLVKLLRRPDIRSVMLRHEDDFDFPLELCYLDHPEDPFFVGDRIAVCRWYLGVTSLPDIVSKRVRKVALLKGCAEAFKADEALLNKVYPNRTVTFTRRSEVIEKLFKTSDFDLIHFTGHCRQQDKTSGGLELADGSFLRLIEIGQLESERSFATAQPFVMLNACASAQPYLGLTHHGSFAHRFVGSRACAVVGTLWQVAGAVANEFAQRFYVELASDKPIGQALLAAKLALVHENKKGDSTDEVPPLQRLARQVAVRSYCLFSNPDLRLVA